METPLQSSEFTAEMEDRDRVSAQYENQNVKNTNAVVNDGWVTYS